MILPPKGGGDKRNPPPKRGGDKKLPLPKREGRGEGYIGIALSLEKEKIHSNIKVDFEFWLSLRDEPLEAPLTSSPLDGGR